MNIGHANIWFVTDSCHTFQLSKDGLRYWWNITVIMPDGTYGYDGIWEDSEHKTVAEAIEEAKRGAGVMS